MGKRARRKRRAMQRIAERRYATHPRHYLAYGSNHNLEQMAYRCPDAETVCRAYLQGWKLEFSGVLTIVEAKDREVPLSTWKVTPQDIAALDRYEGYPTLYGKMLLDVVTPTGESHPAFTYVLNKPYQIYPPSATYYRDVYEGYEEWGFDLQYLKDARDEAFEKDERNFYPYEQRYDRLATKVVESYYGECEICGSWVPNDELVRGSESTWICWECAVGYDNIYGWQMPGGAYSTHAGEEWWKKALEEGDA